MAEPKFNLKGIIKLIIFLAILAGIIYAVFMIAIVPKTPATTEQVWDVLVSLGYEPKDVTEQQIEQDSSLTKGISVENDNLHFEFYNFDNKNSAINVYSTAHSLIIRTKMSFPRVEVKTSRANYTIYSLEAGGEYSVAIYVGTTAVYAYCDAEHRSEIDKILVDIGYLKS